ncbi:MAG: Type pilin PilA [Candidatus Saccharibacteria bacterium]|nr:Type pilin PilA [Candidatus Saccharibacteria bacterium]
MSLSSIKKMKNEQGFTIVELLIVIIVIGILAAIIIVAYNGVTTSANDSAAKAAAVTLQKKLEAYNAFNGAYPGTAATTALNTVQSAALQGSGLTIGTPTSANGKTTIQLEVCTAPAAATGYRVTYWSYPNNSLPAIGSAQISGGTNGTACTTYSLAT